MIQNNALIKDENKSINAVYACRGRIHSGIICDFKSHKDNLKTFSVMVNLNMIVKLGNWLHNKSCPYFLERFY